MCNTNHNSPICYICWNGEYSFDYEQVKSFEEEEEIMFTFTDETKLSFQEEQQTHPNVDSLE